MGGESTVERRPKRLRTITPAPHMRGWRAELMALEPVGGDLALVLWRMLRRVHDWAGRPVGERAGVFAFDRDEAYARLVAGCGDAPELIEAFGTVAFLLRAPEAVPARQLVEACRQVYAWAEERSLVEVAMLFAEAAALVEPENPAWANDAGWMCRRASRDERSASWYHRAYGLAARAKDQQEMIRALLGYGALMKDLGNHDEARRYYEKAATRARYTGRRRQAAVARHYLLGWAAEVGSYAEGERHARLALDLYPIHDPQVPALAHDWAFLLVRLRHYTPAILLLELALPRIQLPEIQMVVWGTLACAFAGARRKECFEETEQKILLLSGSHEEYAPAALVHLAEGARLFEEWERAERHATMAVEIARSRKDGGAERVARELLGRIVSRGTAPDEQAPVDAERTQRLTRQFQVRLRNWKAPG